MKLMCKNCGKLFGHFDFAIGFIDCPRCKHHNDYHVTSQSLVLKEHNKMMTINAGLHKNIKATYSGQRQPTT